MIKGSASQISHSLVALSDHKTTGTLCTISFGSRHIADFLELHRILAVL